MSNVNPRNISEKEWAKLEALLEGVHHQSGAGAYAEEYPLMLDPAQAASSMVVPSSDQGQFLCHVGSFRRQLCIGRLELPVALIGSVMTHPSARGQGLATRTLEAVHAWLAGAGIGLAFLWSEERSLYQNLGYHPVGRSFLFRIDDGTRIQLDPTLHIRSATAEDIGPIYEQGLLRSSSLKRSFPEHKRLAAIPGVHGYVAERNGQIVAFGYQGKGRDMREIMHDWGGDTMAVLQLTHTLARRHKKAVGLLTPALPHELPKFLIGKASFSELPVASGVMLDPVGVVEQLRSVIDSGTFVRLRELAQEERRGLPTSLPLIQHLFGPGDRRTQPILRLPFFIWGLDSM